MSKNDTPVVDHVGFEGTPEGDEAAMPALDKTCIDCGNEFTLTSGERRFFNKRGLHEPKRCSPCRDIKRAHTEASEL